MTVLLDKLDDQVERDWYAAAAVEHGWSRKVLLNQIMNRLDERSGVAPSNFTAQLPAADSELARQLTKDPYVFDFLDLTGRAAERDVEQALMGRLQQTLLEFGRGFSFVGRQVQFDVDGDDFFVPRPHRSPSRTTATTRCPPPNAGSYRRLRTSPQCRTAPWTDRTRRPG